MIVVNQGVENTVDLTLSEKATLENPFFLFVFKSDVTKNYVRKVIADQSSFRRRYNRFIFTEGADITLAPTGYWHYTIYEQSSSTNTDETLSTGIVERGKLYVIGTATTHAKHSVTRTYTAYGKGA